MVYSTIGYNGVPRWYPNLKWEGEGFGGYIRGRTPSTTKTEGWKGTRQDTCIEGRQVPINKKIDYILALELPPTTSLLLDLLFASLPLERCSLNRALAAIHKRPIIAHIKVKRGPNSRDPLIQLAI